MSEEEKKAIEWLERAEFFSARLYAPIIFNLIEKQQKEIEDLKEKNKKIFNQYEKRVNELEREIAINSISKEVIRKEIKKLNEKNGISFDMYTGQILKTKEDYQIAILKKLLRRKL